MLSVFCYTEFTVEIPVVGGSFAYLRVELGDFAAFIAARNILLEGIVGSVAVARGWTSCFTTLLNRQPNSLRIHTKLKEGFNLLDPIAVAVLVIAVAVLLLVVYCLMALSLSMIQPSTEIDPNAAYSLAFQSVGMKWAKSLVALGALKGMTTVLLVGALGQARYTTHMARAHMIPLQFVHVHPKTSTPINATLKHHS